MVIFFVRMATARAINKKNLQNWRLFKHEANYKKSSKYTKKHTFKIHSAYIFFSLFLLEMKKWRTQIYRVYLITKKIMFFLNFLPWILSDDEVGLLEPVLADRVHLVPVLLILGNDFNTCIYTQDGVAKLALCDVIKGIGLRDTC